MVEGFGHVSLSRLRHDLPEVFFGPVPNQYLDSMERPGFLRNNEEWIIWLLAGEPRCSATPESLSLKTSIPIDQLHDNFLYLERVRVVALTRDPDRHYPNEIALVVLTEEGRKLYDELKERPDLGEDLF
jgi:hypothetical protein